MKSINTVRNRVKRVNLTMPESMYVQLNAVSQANDIQYLDAIREAITDWMKAKKSELRREGYLARREENLAMLEEFKEIDREVW